MTRVCKLRSDTPGSVVPLPRSPVLRETDAPGSRGTELRARAREAFYFSHGERHLRRLRSGLPGCFSTEHRAGLAAGSAIRRRRTQDIPFPLSAPIFISSSSSPSTVSHLPRRAAPASKTRHPHMYPSPARSSRQLRPEQPPRTGPSGKRDNAFPNPTRQH